MKSSTEALSRLMKSTETLISALTILADNIQSDDGVANQCIRDAADRLEELSIKRHPLSDEEIIKIGFNAGFAVDWDQNEDDSRGEYGFLMGEGDVDNAIFIKFVKAIEKAHGIGD